MLQLSSALTNLPIMSLRTGGAIGEALKPVINPNNLKIEGWYCKDRFSKKTLILLSKDIRDFVPQGIAVDDHDVLSEPEELLRLKDVAKLEFELIGKLAYTDLKRRLGKVSDYATDMQSLFIQKLYIAQPIFKNLTGGQLIVGRTQIVEITDKRVTVKDVDEKARQPAPAMLGA